MNTDQCLFPFHYGQEAEQYTFYRIPKILFTQATFKKLTAMAKILYGLMLDRMQLSMKNGWMDEDGKVYIYFTIEETTEMLDCGRGKAIRLMAELDDHSGIGLITRVRQGLGKPDKIFVHKCVLPAVRNPDFQKYQNRISGSTTNELQEVPVLHTNNTNSNNTYRSDNTSINPSLGMGCETNRLQAYEDYRRYFLAALEFDILKQNAQDSEMLDEILELLVETVASMKATIRIAGDEKPTEVVKSRFMKLNSEHIRYVLDCIKGNTTKVRNIRQYLLAALYNAPTTMNSYYTALVNHDLYGA